MGLFDLFRKKEELPPVTVTDEDVVAVADGELIDISTVSDSVFAGQVLGTSCAFRFDQDKVTICSPANGTISSLFHTGHAFGVLTADGSDLLIHIGINTVEAKGKGFEILGKKEGDKVKAGEPVIRVDLKELRKTYDMSTMIIVTDSEREFRFAGPQKVVRGQSVLA